MKKIDSTTFKTILCVVALFVGGWVSSRPCVWWPHSWFCLFSSYWLLFWGTSSHMCLSFFQFSWWLSTSGPETSGLEWMLCRWWFWRLDEIVVDQLRKSDTLFDFWHRVLISLSCLPSSVNISIPNILLNTVIIFNLNHNLVHRNFLYSCQFISGIYCLSMMICTCIVVFIPRPNLFRLGLYSRLWKLKIEDRLIFSMSMFIDTCGVP